MQFTLVMPDIVLDKDGYHAGKWTMVYDEGFEITTDQHNFFAFSFYKIRSDKNPKNDDDEQTNGYTSICSQTYMGWFKNLQPYTQWGCFYGE